MKNWECYIKTDIKKLDKFPNIDGYIELTDKEGNIQGKLEIQIKRVKNESLLKSTKPEDLPLGLHSYYWQSLNAYNQLEIAKKIKQPILIQQGERDYQVTMTDFNLWKQALNSNSKNIHPFIKITSSKIVHETIHYSKTII